MHRYVEKERKRAARATHTTSVATERRRAATAELAASMALSRAERAEQELWAVGVATKIAGFDTAPRAAARRRLAWSREEKVEDGFALLEVTLARLVGDGA